MTSLGQVQTQSIQQQQQQLSALASQPNAKTLFVGDLSAFCTEAQLYETFRRFGDIESIKLMRNKKNKPMGYGFVTYVDLDSCHRALVMDGNLFLGRPIRVSSAYFKTNTVPVSPIAALNENSLQSAQVHFSFVSKQNTYVVTEEVIRNIFRQFGEVKDVCIKKSVAHKESGGQSGYGFVHFPLNAEGVAAAIEATHVLCQILIDEVLYDCCLTHSLETFLKENYSSYSNSRSQEQSYNRPAHQQPPETSPPYPSNFVGIGHGIPPAQQPQQHQTQQMRNNDYYAPFNQQQQHGQQQSFGYSNGLNNPPSLFTHQFQDPRSQSTGDYHQLTQQAQFSTARVQPQPQQQQTSAIPSFFEFVHHK